MNHLDWVGYAATAVFAASYFCKNPGALRKVQASAAAIWVGYGVVIHAVPIVVANLLVVAIALGSLWSARKTEMQYK